MERMQIILVEKLVKACIAIEIPHFLYRVTIVQQLDHHCHTVLLNLTTSFCLYL